MKILLVLALLLLGVAPAAAQIAPSAPGTATVSNVVLKSTAALLYGFQVTTGATAGIVFVFDNTALPSNGAVTAAMGVKKYYQLAANSTLGVSYSPPLDMANGAVIGFSSGALLTLTASTTAVMGGEAVAK